MARRSFQKGEPLLGVLSVLIEEPMSERELLHRFRERFGRAYRFSVGSVLIALEALEAEGLVEATTHQGATVYRATPDGSASLDQRARDDVLRRGERLGISGESVDAPVGGELEDVAILFTDVVGSTELLDRVGDDVAHELRRRHFSLLRAAIHDHGGREVKSLGDGLMVAFESPPVAVRCGLAMQHAVAAYDDPLELRIGIASGEAALEDDDYFGRPVVVARRLCDAARSGDVLVSGSSVEFAAGADEAKVEGLAPLALKGLSEPVTAVAMRAPLVGNG
jgi:class 3 adenylate cyclase